MLGGLLFTGGGYHHALLMIINYDVALAIARRLAEMARKHQLNQCINSCTSCTNVCIMAASLLLCSGPGRLADRSLHEDGQPCMSEGFKQAARHLLVMAVNEGTLDEKNFGTHKNMIQIVGNRCIKIYQIRRPPEPVVAVAASLGDIICRTSQPLPTVLMSVSTKPGSPGPTVPELPASTVLCTAPTSSLASHRARSRSPRPVAMKAGPRAGPATLLEIGDQRGCG